MTRRASPGPRLLCQRAQLKDNELVLRGASANHKKARLGIFVAL